MATKTPEEQAVDALRDALARLPAHASLDDVGPAFSRLVNLIVPGPSLACCACLNGSARGDSHATRCALYISPGTDATATKSVAKQDVLADLKHQIHRLRANHCPTMRFGFSPEEIADAVRSEIDEVTAEPIGSARAQEESAGVIAVALHLAIAHGTDLEGELAREVERLRRRLDHVEAGGTWVEAKAIERGEP